MNIAHLLNPYYMIKSIFIEGGNEYEYELNNKAKGADLEKFNELISTLDSLAQDEEIESFDDSFIYIALSNDGIELTGNFGEEPEDDEDEDEDYGSVYFQFDNLGEFKGMDTENA